MRIEPGRVVLSRRNLLSLLSKLDGSPADSACTIEYDGVFVSAEEDEVHYSHPGRPAGLLPGVMHPDTEAALAGNSAR